MNPARLVLPAIRLDRGATGSEVDVLSAVDLGVGGFVLFGGTADAVARLTDRLRERAGRRLVFAADLERGAGQQFEGCTRLPPAGAIGRLDDVDAVRRAARITAREARALGIEWIFAPVADLGVWRDNPIVGTRAWGEEAGSVSLRVTAWIEACQSEGVAACAKHFPGHGRTTDDSHERLPVVREAAETLAHDLRPFEAAVEAGVASVMTAHVAYPAFDREDTPATRSRALVEGVLRGRLGYRGVVVTDALIMAGAGDARRGVDALRAGVDVLVYPRDLKSLLADLAVPELSGAVERATSRLDTMLAGLEGPAADPTAPGSGGTSEHAAASRDLARRSLVWVRPPTVSRTGPRGTSEPGLRVLVFDDDEGDPSPDRTAFAAGLERQGARTRTGSLTLIAVFSDVRAWKGRAGPSPELTARVGRALETHPDAWVVLFADARHADAFPAAPLLCAWGGSPLMQEAAAEVVCEALE